MAAPERLDPGGGLVLHRWRPADAEALTLAIAESIEHLRPWMPWATGANLEEQRATLARWDEEWDGGGDLTYGLFLDSVVVGALGLHRRIGPGGLEIGYWVHAAHTRRGHASAAAAALTTAAFTRPGIEVVEIHHDRANLASEGVPRKLGYSLVGERPGRGAPPPADSGTFLIWRMPRDRWRPSGASSPPPQP
jgi:RimJ/RimL family protein N-acetyltransferase